MKLENLQGLFAQSLFYQHDDIIAEIKPQKNISAFACLQVYRNSFVMGITDALSITYQHTLALVGEQFFNAVTRHFILNSPPKENNIVTYGAGFGEYLQTLPQLSTMPYVAEMARFEWQLETTTNKPLENIYFDTEKLANVEEAQLDNVAFTLATQITLFSSEQNIKQLYQMILNDAVTATDLNQACYLALIKQPNFSVQLVTLSEDEFLLLQQISQQKRLAAIKPTTLHACLPSLLEKALLNGFILAKEK